MAAPVAMQEQALRHVNVCGLDRLPTFSIRNGPPQNAVSLLVKATIPGWAQWVHIEGMPPARAMAYTDAFMTVHRDHLAANRLAAWSDNQFKKAWIVLGVARAVATAYYEITPADLIPGEAVASGLRYRAPVAAAEGVVAVTEEVMIAPGIVQERIDNLSADLALTEVEQAVIARLVLACVGIIPLQGYSLMLTGHHYLSDAKGQSRKAFAAVEKQFWKSDDVAQWFEEDADFLRDLLWHKACHPVSMTLKHITACNEDVKDMLVTVGAGSAATRLPATEPDVRAGQAFKSLFDTLRPFFVMFGGQIDSTIFDVALDTVRSYVPGIEQAVIDETRDARVPATVVNRRTAVRWVHELVEKNSSMAAHCYGFYVAMGDQSSGLATTATSDTLRTAFSLKKLPSTHVPSYTMGYQSYADYLAAKNKLRAKAVYVAPGFTAIA